MTDPPPWSTNQLAAYDQLLARLDREVDNLVRTLQTDAAKTSEQDAMARISGLLAARSSNEARMLLVAALRRLSQLETT